MRKIFVTCLVLLLFTISGSTALAAEQEITVSTARQLIAALGSDRIIILKPGNYNLSRELGNVSLDNTSNDGVAYATIAPGILAREVFDGRELSLNGLKNLTIRGEAGGAPVQIIADAMYAHILTFNDCQNIKLENITVGHSKPGFCRGGVLAFKNSSRLYLTSVHMFGSGIRGLTLEGVADMVVSRSSVYGCSESIMEVKKSKNISFYDCVFHDNEGAGIITSDTVGVTIDQCEFRNNHAVWFGVEGSKKIVIKNTKFINNELSAEDSEFKSDAAILFENNTYSGNMVLSAG